MTVCRNAKYCSLPAQYCDNSPEGKVLLPDALLGEPVRRVRVVGSQPSHEARHEATDAALALVQCSDEQVPHLPHQGS